ncbi:MAG: EAL domain-containing protein [Succinivibrionaceae bacterium]|nr:EAL domain-containing protein [Succinivibrionaceae bacterium]
MYYIRLPFSRQVIINFILTLTFCVLCAYMIFSGASYVNSNQESQVSTNEINFVSARVEAKVEAQISNLLLKIELEDPQYINLPDNIAYIEWNNLQTKKKFTQYVNNWYVSEKEITNFIEKSLKLNNNVNLSFICNVNCYTLIFHKLVIANQKGYSVIAIDAKYYNEAINQISPLPKLFVPLKSNSNNWLDEKITPESFEEIVTLNRYNESIPRLSDIIGRYKDNATYNDLINDTDLHNDTNSVNITPVIFKGGFFGQIITYVPLFSLHETIEAGIINNLTIFIITAILFVIIICYHLFNIIRLIRFFALNSNRLDRYAKLQNINPTSDEIFTLLEHLSKSLDTNEEKDREIAHLNENMSLYSNYDINTGLPNKIWLKEQIELIQAKFKIDNGLNIYLVEFIPQFKNIKTQSSQNLEAHSREISKIIISSLQDGDKLCLIENGIYGILTTNYSNVQSIYTLLDSIKANLSNHFAKHQTCQIKAGILRIYSPSLLSDKIINKVHIAFNTSIASEEADVYTIFNDNLQKANIADSIFEASMRKAKLSGELDTTYSIIYNTKNACADAIYVSPIWYKSLNKVATEDFTDDFVSCGINIEFGYWKIESSIKHLHRIDEETNQNLNLIIPLNFSQLTDTNLLSFLDIMVVNYHILPSRIFFAIKENTLSSDIHCALHAIKQLTTAGFGIHLEQFSLGYLNDKFVQNNHITQVSVPSSIIHRIISSEYDRYMIHENLKQAKLNQKFKIICEGADNLVLAKAINEMGIDFISGALLPQFKNINDIIAILKENTNLIDYTDKLTQG